MLRKNINAEIITIGDEILIGQIVDTNSAWMGQTLNDIGINVCQITSISDNSAHIVNALQLASSRADLILVTGGLGPTKDDITKETIALFFNAPLERNEQVLLHIRELLGAKNIEMNELNIRQADVPRNCKIISNSTGTAPGMWFERDNKVFVFMPGVPYEMKTIMTDELIPRLKSHFDTPAIVHKTLMLQGIPESKLAKHIETWETELPSHIKLAYLPSPGFIRLRLTAKGESRETLERSIGMQVQKLLPLVKEWHYAYDDETLEITLGKILKNNNFTISTAESCTGGRIASLITSVPGSSAYFKGSVVAYSNDIKTSVLGVNAGIIRDYGAVSKPVVEEMAVNAIRRFDTDFAISTSGIAGPDGGTKEKPVGTVWIAVASRNQVVAKMFSFGETNRERNIQRATLHAMNEMRRLILLSGKPGSGPYGCTDQGNE